MSFNQFVLMLKQDVTDVGVFSLDGENLASTKDFSLSKDEVISILNMYDKGSAFLSDVFKFKGNEFTILKADSENIQMRYHSAGLMISKCKTCFIFAYHTDRVQPQNCYESVVRVADILRSYGY